MPIKVSPLLHSLMINGKNNPLTDEYTIENNNGIINASKNARYIHSKYNIEKESISILNANIDTESKKNIFAFYGFGLGHHITFFTKKFAPNLKNIEKQNIHIIVFVTDVPLFIYSYYNLEMSNIAKYDTTFLHYNEDVALALKDVDIASILGVNFIMLPSIEREYKNVASLVHTSILETIEKKFSDLLTKLHFENLWIKNILKNSAEIDKYPSALKFKNILKGFNALIVAAGPTLNNHIDTIKKNRENLFIIAADTALASLSSNGIAPDIVITMDAGIYNTYDFIYNNLDFPFLFTDIISQPSVNKINKDKSNIVLFSSNENSNIIEYIENSLNIQIQKLNTSFTVATAAIELANFLGIQNAILIGFDNSFPNYERHAKHTLSFDYSLLRINKINTMESMYFNAIKEQSDLEKYPPSNYILESQIDYISQLKYENMNILRIKSSAIGIESIDKNISVNEYAENNARSNALKKMYDIYKNSKQMLENSTDKNKIQKMYIEIQKIFTSLIKNLYENYNDVINYSNNNSKDDDKFYNEKLNETMNNIANAEKKVAFIKNIISHTSIVISRSNANDKEKILLLTTEAIKSINYFNTRIEQILSLYNIQS